MRTRRPAFLLTAALLASAACAGQAFAVLAPEYYEQARRSAANHVQIDIEDVDEPGGGMGDCVVTGKVAKVFRGDLMPGAEIAFSVACYDYGDMPVGGTLWTDMDALSDAKVLEAFMTAGPKPRILLDQVEIVPEARDRPYCDDDSLRCETGGAGRPAEQACGVIGRAWAWTGLGARACR